MRGDEKNATRPGSEPLFQGPDDSQLQAGAPGHTGFRMSWLLGSPSDQVHIPPVARDRALHRRLSRSSGRDVNLTRASILLKRNASYRGPLPPHLAWLAEGEGFEPSGPVSQAPRFPSERTRPLCDPSEGVASKVRHGFSRNVRRTANWRRGRDSNPRCRNATHRFSRPAPSTTQAPLRTGHMIRGNRDVTQPFRRPFSSSGGRRPAAVPGTVPRALRPRRRRGG